MTRNRNHKRGKVIANIIKVKRSLYILVAELQTMTGNRNHKRGKVIANIIKVKGSERSSTSSSRYKGVSIIFLEISPTIIKPSCVGCRGVGVGLAEHSH